MHGQGQADIPAIDELKMADCLVLYIRRLALPTAQLDTVRAYLESGKPLVALRIAIRRAQRHFRRRPWRTSQGS